MHTNKACRKDGCGVLRLHGRKNTSIFREDCSELFSMNEYLIHILSRDLVDCAGDKSVLGELTLSSVLDKLSHNQNALFTGCIDACYKYYTYKLNCCVDDYVFQISSSTEKYSGESKGNGCIMIIGDIKTKQMVVWTSHSILARLEEVNLLEIKEMEVIDLNNTGCYWEGGVLNGQCFGYGKEYNEENMLVYEGFKYGGRRVCYGKEYRGIRENKNKSSGLIYEGGYCNGDRYGFGALYDLKGDIEFEGKWVDNNPIANDILLLKHDNELLVSMLIEELTIGDNLYNDREITILHFTPLFIHLKRIEIGNECFENVHDFMLDGLKELKSVYIGYGCFSVLSDECMDYPFSIINCPHLEKLYIDNDSFQNFDRFEISNANSLQLLIIHHYCFEKVHEFMLTGLTSLNDVSIGWGFAGCSRDECEDCIFSITDCPNLIRLEIQDGCFKYFNQFILSNVKSLTFLLLGEDCFGKVREFVLDGLESLESVTIDKNCFGISEEECEDAICSIINCPNLTTLNFKEKSFQYFNHFELLNVNDLNTIIFGGYNFRYAYCILKETCKNDNLIDLPLLKTVYFKQSSFQECSFIQFENLPKLTTLSFKGASALDGDNRDECKTIINGHVSFDNMLVMRNLPSLTSIECQVGCKGVHDHMGTVILENIPNLTRKHIQYGEYPFYSTAELKESNASDLANYIREYSLYLTG